MGAAIPGRLMRKGSSRVARSVSSNASVNHFFAGTGAMRPRKSTDTHGLSRAYSRERSMSKGQVASQLRKLGLKRGMAGAAAGASAAANSDSEVCRTCIIACLEQQARLVYVTRSRLMVRTAARVDRA